MALAQVIAAFQAVLDSFGLPGNLLVILTIALERRFHMMRYVLLASLAASDFLFLIFVHSFRIASIAQEKWIYGETMCYLNAFFARYFYINTVVHLMAVSHDRYKAIVKSPLTYHGSFTKVKVLSVAFIWVIPIPFSIGPFVGVGKYVYNPEVFYCEDWWVIKNDVFVWKVVFLIVIGFAVPFVAILLLNWSVYKTAKRQAINAAVIQVGSLEGSENQQQDASVRITERKAAVDVSIIIVAFLLCFLPGWIVSIFRQVAQRSEVPAEVVLLTSCVFMVSSLCNPIIYSVRKRDFRNGVKNVLRRIGLCRSDDHIDNNLRTRASTFTSAEAGLSTQHQDGRLSPMPDIQLVVEASSNDIENNAIGISSLRLNTNL